jgi:hypothetical protein
MKSMPVRMFAPVLLCLWAMPVFSAPQDEIEVERAYLNADKKDLVAQAMNMDATTAKSFWPLYNEYQEQLRRIGDRKVHLIMDYAQNYSTISDEKAKQLTDDYLKIQQEFLDVQQQYVKKFRKSFSNSIVARYFQIENKINAAINIGLAKNIPLVQLP